MNICMPRQLLDSLTREFVGAGEECIDTNVRPDQPKKRIFSLAQRAYTTALDVQPSGPRIHPPNTSLANSAHTSAFSLTAGLVPVRHLAPSDIYANPRRTAEESLRPRLTKNHTETDLQARLYDYSGMEISFDAIDD
ncbi:hypothetical protein B0H14DRAFT_3504428 [Mycena olivaceomarginata]|nr:hypothetical protein B0H14DRAFT_3504428 [Mycena olivaceomarginata]